MEYFTIYGEALSPYRTSNDDKAEHTCWIKLN